MHFSDYPLDSSLAYLSVNPWFVTGLVEAEGYFSMYKDYRQKTAFNIAFTIEMLKRDQDLMVKIKNFFGCGNISFNEKKGTCKYSVTSIQDVVKYIIPHFSKYPLRGTKYLDFLDFSKGIHLIL